MRRNSYTSGRQHCAWLVITAACCWLAAGKAAADWHTSLQQAEAALASKKYADALRLYEQAVSHNAACVPAYRGLVCCYDALGNARGAVIYMETLYLEKPESAEICYGLGYALYVSKNYADATRYFEKAVALQPELAEAWNNCAAIYHYVKRDYAKARQYYERAITLSSRAGNQRVHNIARENMLHLPDPQELAQAQTQLTLEEFINQCIAQAEARADHALRLLICNHKENTEQAAAWFLAQALQASAHGKSSEEQTALQLAGILEQHYRSCFDSFALRGSLEAYAGLDASSKALLFKGESLLQAGLQQQNNASGAARAHFIAALACFENIKDRTRAGQALLYLGDLERSQKAYAQASEAYCKALTCFIEVRDEPHKADALALLGASSYEQGQIDEALDFLRRASKIYHLVHDHAAAQKVLGHISTIEAGRTKQPLP